MLRAIPVLSIVVIVCAAALGVSSLSAVVGETSELFEQDCCMCFNAGDEHHFSGCSVCEETPESCYDCKEGGEGHEGCHANDLNGDKKGSELFNLLKDLGETNDLSENFNVTRKELTDAYEAWKKATEAEVPVS